MVRGALFTLRRKCGKPNCHCVSGEPHETPALAYPEGGKTKTLTLSDADAAEVRVALRRYTTARAKLDKAADVSVAALRARKEATRGGKRL
jgi:nucleoid-associated protein YgaU